MKTGEYLVLMRGRGDDRLLLSMYLHEMARTCRIEARERDRDGMQAQLGEANALLNQMDQERGSLEEQLWEAYKQIDHITETLQKELKTKEELATELRDSYNKLRQRNFPASPAPTHMSLAGFDEGRGSSASLRRQTPPRTSDASTRRRPDASSSLEGFDPTAALSGLGAGSFYEDEMGDSIKTCTWTSAIKAMKTEGLLHQADGSSGIL